MLGPGGFQKQRRLSSSFFRTFLVVLDPYQNTKAICLPIFVYWPCLWSDHHFQRVEWPCHLWLAFGDWAWKRLSLQFNNMILKSSLFLILNGYGKTQFKQVSLQGCSDCSCHILTGWEASILLFYFSIFGSSFSKRYQFLYWMGMLLSPSCLTRAVLCQCSGFFPATSPLSHPQLQEWMKHPIFGALGFLLMVCEVEIPAEAGLCQWSDSTSEPAPSGSNLVLPQSGNGQGVS